MRRGLAIAMFLTLIMAAGIRSGWAAPKNDLTIQGFGLMSGNILLEYERVVTGDSAMAVRVNGFSNLMVSGTPFSGFGGGFSYRLYPFSQGRAPQGIFVGPRADIQKLTRTYMETTISAVTYEAGIEIGYRFIWGDINPFVLAPALMVIYKGGTISEGILEHTGMALGAGLGMGIAF